MSIPPISTSLDFSILFIIDITSMGEMLFFLPIFKEKLTNEVFLVFKLNFSLFIDLLMISSVFL